MATTIILSEPDALFDVAVYLAIALCWTWIFWGSLALLNMKVVSKPLVPEAICLHAGGAGPIIAASLMIYTRGGDVPAFFLRSWDYTITGLDTLASAAGSILALAVVSAIMASALSPSLSLRPPLLVTYSKLTEVHYKTRLDNRSSIPHYIDISTTLILLDSLDSLNTSVIFCIGRSLWD